MIVSRRRDTLYILNILNFKKTKKIFCSKNSLQWILGTSTLWVAKTKREHICQIFFCVSKTCLNWSITQTWFGPNWSNDDLKLSDHIYNSDNILPGDHCQHRKRLYISDTTDQNALRMEWAGRWGPRCTLLARSGVSGVCGYVSTWVRVWFQVLD